LPLIAGSDRQAYTETLIPKWFFKCRAVCSDGAFFIDEWGEGIIFFERHSGNFIHGASIGVGIDLNGAVHKRHFHPVWRSGRGAGFQPVR
jgi:hypothetical protein